MEASALSNEANIDVLHLVPGDGDELLMESVAIYSSIPVAIMTIFNGPSQLQTSCKSAGVLFRSLNATRESYIQLARQFKAVLRELNPKVIYFHGVTASIIGSILRITMRQRPILVSVRHHNRMYHAMKLNSLKVLVADQIAIRLMNRIVAVSDSVKETLISEWCGKDKITVIYNGLDRQRQQAESRVNSSDPVWETDKLKILAVGKMSRQKDFETMLQVVSLLKLQTQEIELVVLGAGNQIYQDEMQSLALRLGIAGNVRWMGWQSDVDPWFDSCDIFLHTAIDEACPLVLIEAMIHGTPVVSSNAGGCKDVLEGFYKGIPAGHPESFCQEIINVHRDLPNARKYAVSIISDVQRKFSAQNMVNDYTTLTKIITINQKSKR